MAICTHPNIEWDIIDMGDDGDGYVAYGFVVCSRCNASARTLEELQDIDDVEVEDIE